MAMLRAHLSIAGGALRGGNRFWRHRASAATINSNDLGGGSAILIDGEPYSVLNKEFHKPGKGQAVVRTKVKNLLTNNTRDVTFKADEKVDQANVFKAEMQYVYSSNNVATFMDMTTFDSIEVPMENAAWADLIKEGITVDILTWEERVIGVTLPTSVDLTVVETEPGIRGNRQNAGSKPAKVESGATINVPLFVEQGDVIRVETSERKYLRRAN